MGQLCDSIQRDTCCWQCTQHCMQALIAIVTAITRGERPLQIDWPEGVSLEVLVVEGLDASAAVDLMHGRNPTAILRMAYDHNRGL